MLGIARAANNSRPHDCLMKTAEKGDIWFDGGKTGGVEFAVNLTTQDYLEN